MKEEPAAVARRKDVGDDGAIPITRRLAVDDTREHEAQQRRGRCPDIYAQLLSSAGALLPQVDHRDADRSQRGRGGFPHPKSGREHRVVALDAKFPIAPRSQPQFTA